MTNQEKLEQIAALIEAWRRNDSPEGEMSAGWLLGPVAEMAIVLGTGEDAGPASEELDAKAPDHLLACGTQYRGCAPGCSFQAYWKAREPEELDP